MPLGMILACVLLVPVGILTCLIMAFCPATPPVRIVDLPGPELTVTIIRR